MHEDGQRQPNTTAASRQQGVGAARVRGANGGLLREQVQNGSGKGSSPSGLMQPAQEYGKDSSPSGLMQSEPDVVDGSASKESYPSRVMISNGKPQPETTLPIFGQKIDITNEHHPSGVHPHPSGVLSGSDSFDDADESDGRLSNISAKGSAPQDSSPRVSQSEGMLQPDAEIEWSTGEKSEYKYEEDEVEPIDDDFMHEGKVRNGEAHCCGVGSSDAQKTS